MVRSNQRGILLVEWAAYAGLMAILVSIGAGFINNTLSTRNNVAGLLGDESLQLLIAEDLGDQLASGINGDAPGTQALTSTASVWQFLHDTAFGSIQSGPSGWIVIAESGPSGGLLQTIAPFSFTLASASNPHLQAIVTVSTGGVLVVNGDPACGPAYESDIAIDTACQTLTVGPTTTVRSQLKKFFIRPVGEFKPGLRPEGFLGGINNFSTLGAGLGLDYLFGFDGELTGGGMVHVHVAARYSLRSTPQ